MFVNFSEAIEAVKKGKMAAMEGWNGKGMYIFRTDVALAYVLAEGKNEAGEIKLEPFIILKTAQGKYVPWNASQTDMESEKWIIIE